MIAALSGCRRARVPVPDRAPPPVPVAPTVPAPTAPPANAQLALPSGRSIADVAERVTPSVVNVFSERRLRQPRLGDPFAEIFGGPAHPRRALSLGSGVIVSKDGVIVTNHHVVAQADTIRVSLKDGRVLTAKVVGSDPRSDVAVLRVDAHDLPAIEVADASKIRVGDLVLAIGDPFGIGQTVTMGIISATGRANLGITDVEDFIQTDAAINPGNSGGALVDMDGRLVGLNTAIVSGNGGYQGIGFAIPSTIVVQVADQLLRHGKVVRGYLGASLEDLPADAAAELHVPPRGGVLVVELVAKGPGARAGLRKGDVITAVNRVATPDAAHVRNQIALAGPTHVVVDVLRDGKPLALDVALAEAPREPDMVSSEP
ncbi:MAG TPA: trypsin-like peptidase domain-containing protein [Kofleriaceae bacterium]|nr:trypsin-like peptidase domain-containing protein [Kofleriaceae bacterium]